MSSHPFETSNLIQNKTNDVLVSQRHRSSTSQKFIRTSTGGGAAGFMRCDNNSPPPAPPVRDSSSLGSIKYGPGHEKFPSWPVPAAAGTLTCSTSITTSGGSTRSKSWTDHTNYPKEKLIHYTRPYMKGQLSQQHMEQKLKTVMERCEKIPPQAFESSQSYSLDNNRFTRQTFHLPNVDHDGKSLDDIDYVIPSPPERDLSKYHLTQKNLKFHGRNYDIMPAKFASVTNKFNGGMHKLTENDIKEFMEYTKTCDDSQCNSNNIHHQTQISYAQSEGYHSYVSSTDSSTCTPFLDRLRLDNESAVPSMQSNFSRTWNDGISTNYGDAAAAAAAERQDNDRRDNSVLVVVPKNSDNETLKWHGSMSDVSSVISSGTSIHHSDQLTNQSTKQLIVHSARVQIPQRHHSESVLYINGHKGIYKKGSSIKGNTSPRKDSGNSNKNSLKLFPITTYSMQEEKGAVAGANNTTSNNKDNKNRFYSSFQLSKFTVAERINEFEMQQQKYSYLDPNKKHKVPDPTLKAIQKKALLSFYERHQQNDCSKHNKNSSWKSEPQLLTNQQSSNPLHSVSATPSTATIKSNVSLPSRRASSASDYAAVNNSKRHGLALSLESKTTDNITNSIIIQPKHQSINTAARRSCDGVSLDFNRSAAIEIDISEVPPERPPKNPNLKVAFSHLFKSNVVAREPSPDLPLPSPPIVSENEIIIDNETPLPPPPTESILNWKQQFNNNRSPPNKEQTNSHSRHQISYKPAGSPSYENQVISSEIHSKNNNDDNKSNAGLKRSLIHSQNLNNSSSTTRSVNNNNVLKTLPIEMKAQRKTLENNCNEHIVSSSYSSSRTIASIQSPAKKILDPHFTNLQNNNCFNFSPNSSSSSTKSPKLLKSALTSKTKIPALCVNKNNNFPSSPPLCVIDSINSSTPLTAQSILKISSTTTYSSQSTPTTTTISDFRHSTSQSSNEFNDTLNSLSSTSVVASCNSIQASSHNQENSISCANEQFSFNNIDAESQSASDKDVVVSQTEYAMEFTLMSIDNQLPEEIDCDAYSKEFINHLPPPSDRLKDLLVPGPKRKKPIDYVEDLFKIDIDLKRRTEAQLQLRSNNSSLSNDNSALLLSNSDASIDSKNVLSTSTILPSVNLLSNSSLYFTTSEPKAKMLTKCNQDINNQCPAVMVTNAKDLNQKKRELVNRLDKKLQVLKKAALALSEECRINDELGVNVKNYINQLAKPQEISKYLLHVDEVGKITSLLLSLSGRLARAENALMSMTDDDHMEKNILETKRDKLLEQLEEAKRLKECIDKRSITMSNLLHTYLNDEKYSDYDHFINMKTKLIIDSKEIGDKIKLGEEQLSALKEIPII